MDHHIAPSDPALSPDNSADGSLQIGPKPKSRRWLLALAVLVIVVIIAGVAFWLLRSPAKAPAHAKTTAPPNGQPTVDTSGSSSPMAYISNGKDLNLNFTYPANWQVSPASNNNSSDQTITLTSPRTSMADASDESVIARAVILIRPRSSDLTELDAGTATIALTSIQIAYAHPTKVQHGYPYITYIHLAGGDNPKKLFEEIMITGAAKFSAGQTLASYSLINLDPVVSVAFYQCVTEQCSGGGAQPLSITSDTWQSSDLGQQTLGIFESLQIH